MHQEFAHRLGKPWFELRAFSYLPYGHSRVGRESFHGAFVGKGLPTYKYLSRFTLAESANDFRQVRYAV
jgi:hypothetical protein